MKLRKIAVVGMQGFVGAQILESFVRLKRHRCVYGIGTIRIKDSKELDWSNLGRPDLIIYCAETGDKNFVNTMGVGYKKSVEKNLRRCLSSCDHLIYLSSSDVYQVSEVQISELDPISSHSKYTEMKLDMEDLVLDKSHTVLRVPCIFNKSLNKSGVIGEIVKKCNGNLPLSFQNADYMLDMLFIDDLVKVLDQITLDPISGVYNCGGNFGGISIRELAVLIKQRVFPNESQHLLIESVESRTVGRVLSSLKLLSATNIEPWNSNPMSILGGSFIA